MSMLLSEKEASEVKINIAEIPISVRDDLAAATLDFIHGILRQPGGREMLDARTAARKAAQVASQQNG